MSKTVDLTGLAEVLGGYGFAYVISVGDDYRAHTTAVAPALVDGLLDVGPVGRHTRANAAAHPNVTVLWPPATPGGYSLIVDGHAEAADPLTIRPGRAVLHRPATDDSPASRCAPAYDCVEIAAPN